MDRLSVTSSVCPVCLRRVSASRVWEGRLLYLRKTCPEHGEFKTIVRRGDVGTWDVPVPVALDDSLCPYACGDCAHDGYG